MDGCSGLAWLVVASSDPQSSVLLDEREERLVETNKCSKHSDHLDDGDVVVVEPFVQCGPEAPLVFVLDVSHNDGEMCSIVGKVLHKCLEEGKLVVVAVGPI